SHSLVSHSPTGSSTHASLHRKSRSPVAQPSALRTSSPGSHAPVPVHSPNASHTHSAVQRSGWVPQLSQVPSRVVPGLHSPVSPSQSPYSQRPPLVQKRLTVPHAPQGSA